MTATDVLFHTGAMKLANRIVMAPVRHLQQM